MANLSAEGVETVIQLEQKNGRQYLRDLLGWKEFDEIRDLRRSIYLDTMYRSLVFAAEKGFSWPAVAEVGNVAEMLLEEAKGLPVSEAIRILQGKLSTFRVELPAFQLRALCDYFHNTFIKHYHLYQFVLGRERDQRQSFACLEVYPPPKPLPLTNGIDLDLWKYQQQLAELSAAEEEKRAAMWRLQETLCVRRDNLVQEIFRSVKRQSQILTKEALVSLVQEVIKAHIQSLQDIFQNEVQTTFEILHLKLQKKSLLLNPPPPYPPLPVPEVRGKRSSKMLKKLQRQEKMKESKDKMEKEEKKKKKKK